MGEEDYKTVDQLKCKNKIILSDNENPQYSFIKKIEKKKDKVYFDKDKYGIMTFERHWDFVDWLNQW